MAVPLTTLAVLICVNLTIGKILNMALKKPATMSSEYGGDSLPAGRAVDGVITSRFPNVIHTAVNETWAWWKVDLQTHIQNATVKIHFRTDYKWRRNGVQLYTSETKFHSHPVSRPCHTWKGRPDGYNIPNVVSVNCPGLWRYLMVYTLTDNDNKGAILDFGEVEIFGCNKTYGQNCDKSCHSRQCSVTPTSCDRYTGECPPGGCQAGWMGIDCGQHCVTDTYGPGCNKSCKDRKCTGSLSSCDHVTGHCKDGCKTGWNDTDCTQKCPPGTYGNNCNLNCISHHCLNLSVSCHHVTGACPDDECEPGWNGTDCTQECPSGTYGPSCKYICGHCTNHGICHHETGDCPGDCSAGWRGKHCKLTCESKKYGVNCLKNCGHCNGECNTMNGHCPDGCEIGYNGSLCNILLQPDGFSLFAAGTGAAAAVLVVIIIIIVIIVIVYRRQSASASDNKQSVTQSHVAQNGSNMYINVDVIPEQEMGHEDGNQHVHGKPVASKSNPIISNDPEPEEEILEEDAPSPNRDYYNDIEDVIRGVPVGDLVDTVQKIKRREGGFETEYYRLPAGFTAPYDDSQKPENTGKNKFRGYYPYDHNRVRLSLLPGIPGSDYINASLMHSYNKKKTYIASQAPNKKTVGDFWRMIWEHRCERVIMLTGLVENMTVKCFQYWSDGSPLETDHFRVETKATDTRTNYVVRRFKATCINSGEIRTVVQYHFTSWPDHDVPDTLALVNFIWMMRRTYSQTGGPLLVHCSAGIGRTGTYIAVDSLLDQAQDEGMVDVQGYVSVMREQRKNMIQTKEQYECVFHCLVEMTTFGNTSMDVENFTTSYSSRGMDSMVERKTIRELTQMTIREEHNYASAHHQMWVDGNQDFIVRVGPTLKHLCGYMLAVTPPPGLENLLWKLVEENNVHDVIVVSRLQEDLLVEQGKAKKFGSVTLTSTDQTHLTSDLTMMTLQLQTKQSGRSHDVKVFKFNSLPTIDSMSSRLLEHTQLQHLSAEMTPVVLIHSDLDRKFAVMLCIMGNILNEILEDHRVDVMSHVRTFLKCSPDLEFTLPDVEKLHEFAKDCVQMTKNYSTYSSVQ